MNKEKTIVDDFNKYNFPTGNFVSKNCQIRAYKTSRIIPIEIKNKLSKISEIDFFIKNKENE